MSVIPQRLARARFVLLKHRPYLAAVVFRLVPVPRPGLGGMAVDRYWRLYFDPEAVSRWSSAELATVLYHEVFHLLRDHAARGEVLATSPKQINVAADAEINDDIVAERIWEWPLVPITPRALGLPERLLLEEYVQLLKEQERGESRSSFQKLPGSPLNQLSTERVVESERTTNADEVSLVPGAGNCGSCAHGRLEPHELPAPTGEAPDGVQRWEQERIRRQVAREILSAQKSRSAVPGHWARWAQQMLRPQVDWRRELGALVRRALADALGRVDYTYARPSRRQSVLPRIVLPSLRAPRLSVAVVVDTSGSMDEVDLAQALGELEGIVQAVGATVWVLACDAAVHLVRPIHSARQVPLMGGGGTNMAVGIQTAEEKGVNAIVVLTDGLTPWPNRPPRVPVVVGIIGTEKQGPSWARTVSIPKWNRGFHGRWDP